MNKYERMNFQKKAAQRYSSTEIAVIKLYKEVINHLAFFCKDVGAKNVSDVFNVFNVLAHEGYLSYNKTIMTGSKGYFNIFPYDGADLLIGRGNCLHFSNF